VISPPISEHDVLMVLMTDDGVLDLADNASHGRLAGDKQQGAAKHRPGSP
jgi:hypothetical protein